MANKPYITEKTEAEILAMIDLAGLDDGRMYHITDLNQHIMGTSTTSYAVLNTGTGLFAFPEPIPAPLSDPTPSAVLTPSGGKKSHSKPSK